MSLMGDAALANRITLWRDLVNQWTDACEDVYDLAKAAGDDYPAATWMLAERGHKVGAEFGFALDALMAALSLLDAADDLPLWLLERENTPPEADEAVQRFRSALANAERTLR